MKVTKFFIKHWIIILIWLVGLFLRCYRQDQLLGFYYDQGRDAKMAMEIVRGQNFPAIGPTTGINGLYLGPFWFYLITPGYLFGQGSPVIASYFIAFIESLSIPLIFFILKEYVNQGSAYTASLFWAFSHYLIRSSRWFSNPSPLPTFVLVLMYLLHSTVHHKKPNYLLLISLMLGLALQLEAASAVFFIPIITIYFLINYRLIAKIKVIYWLKSIAIFIALLLPQVAFEIKNNFIISKNFLGFITGKVNSNTGKSWSIPNFEFIQKRLFVYYQAYFSKLDTNVTKWSIVLLIIFLVGCIILFIRQRKQPFIQLQLLWFFVPSFILLFFSGNYGTLYDYYLTGFFPAFIIIFSIIVSTSPNKYLKFLLITLTTYIFVNGNYLPLKNYLSAGTDGPTHITLGNELAIVDLACQKNNQEAGNIDYYVPPVIAHSYEYLVSWRQSQHRCPNFDSNPNNNVYVIYEVDPPHPERLENWLDKYKHDYIVSSDKIGGITLLQLNRK